MRDPTPPPVNFIDNPHAPEVFASNCAGFFMHDGNITLTFESARIDHGSSPGPVNRVVMARLVIPVRAAQALVVGLNAYLEGQGLSPSQAAATGQTAQ